MEQLDLFPASLAIARAVGAELGEMSLARAERAEPGFGAAAQRFIAQYLRERGPASSEELTDACVMVGLAPPDERAFGPIYAAMARRGEIKQVGDCARRKGHGAAGGRVWAIA